MLLSLVLITVYFRESAGGGLHSVQGTGATVLRPFEIGANRVAAPFRDTYGWFSGLIHAKSENARLRRQVDRLTQLSIQNATAAQQVEDYRRQLHYVGLPRFPQDYNYVATDVISRPPSEFQQQIGIAAGSSSGIRVNDPVVTPDGLVGTISQVTGHQAQVTLLTDPNLYVSAFDLNTQAAGVVSHGQGQGTLNLEPGAQVGRAERGRHDRHAGLEERQPQLDLPVRHPDRVRQRRLEPRGRPLLERAGRTAGELRFAAQRARAGPEEAEPAVSVNLLEPLKVAVLVFVASILQVTIFSQIDILGGYPDVVLLTLVAIALLRGSIYGAASGFFAGLIVDTANLGTLGVTSLLLTIAGYWIGRYGETTGRDRAHAPFVSVAVATVLVQFGALIMHYLLGDPVSARTVLLETLPSKVLLNLLLTLPVYALTRWLLGLARPVEAATEVRLLG